ncbi:class I mannose-6-phosphate isomerase [Dysgonomonas sp. Marseille-P4677]|uniref:class I mannose-6-phosphate isomerase n=1 Tax=Dysgonomonas sp. Marseille-P4677 TaxID=2364790 RepID=UPI00191332E3|nr:class I mannose-6-phosphate isomerase [Dysgonomonas sp. Marseille-P4677]MBK5720813.1 class I mannose-6-phosphate isomerase [Dysgonomonas sp. Marseille-P4677]
MFIHIEMVEKSNYDKYPSTKISGWMLLGWDGIIDKFKQIIESDKALIIDMYVGVHEEEIITELKKISTGLLINTRDLFKPEEEIRKMTQRFVTNDPLFGYVTCLTMSDYFDEVKLSKAKEAIAKSKGGGIVVGCGASLLKMDDSCLVYADMARWEHQLRMHKKSVRALGLDNSNEDFASQHKRNYFNDWHICDAHKDQLFDKIDFWLDTHIEDEPKLIDKETFYKGIDQTVKKPFRVVPFFAPAPWGGQWMKEVCDLDRSVKNYGWCFDCVPEENSLLFEINGVLFELPSINLVLLKSRELLGEPVESRFGKEFPIRFDLLDTFGGGYLSFQVHPTTQYIRKNFGMQYTQDESYYMIDAAEDATVYLGLKNDIDKAEMANDLRLAQKGEKAFDAEKYANRLSVKKHDHFLIPGGTVHCSGPEGLVLEISSTPNHFTFKMWDWGRLGLDGKPRPINVERGLDVIDWKRDTDYTMKNLVNHVSIVAEGDGWIEERTGLHVNEFIETRRHRFSSKVTHKTNNSVNVLNLVEGEEIIVESVNNSFAPFVAHYAETFIIPAWLGEYTIRPYGKSEGKECMTIKAYVRFRQ